jgi:hypothetical protein
MVGKGAKSAFAHPTDFAGAKADFYRSHPSNTGKLTSAASAISA